MPGLVEGGFPPGPVGDDVQQPLLGRQVVGVGRGDPAVAGRVGQLQAEGLDQPGFAVGAVVGQGLAGPLAGDQDAPADVAAVLGPVRLPLARAGDQAGPGVLRLDAVPQPVRAGRRARLIAKRLGEPIRVRPLRASLT